MKKLLLLALIAAIAAGCASRKGAKTSDSPKAVVEDRTGENPVGVEGEQPLDPSAQATPAGQIDNTVSPSDSAGRQVIAGAGGAGGAGVGAIGGAGAAAGGVAGLKALTDPSSILSQRSIFFEYDSFVVKDEYRPLVEAHAKFLQENPKLKVFLQGHADERGSREYNLALGQKRADAVRKMMSVLGVTDVQLESVSFGEEKPRALGHNEEAWRQNRRADLSYQGE